MSVVMVCFAAYIYAVASALVGKPNIMLIVADDQGFANIGYHNSTVLTPRIDAITAADEDTQRLLPRYRSEYIIGNDDVTPRSNASPPAVEHCTI